MQYAGTLLLFVSLKQKQKKDEFVRSIYSRGTTTKFVCYLLLRNFDKIIYSI